MSFWYRNALLKMGRGAYNLDNADAVEVIPIRTAGGGGGPYYTPDENSDTTLSVSVPNNGDCRPVAAQALDNVSFGIENNKPTLNADDEVFASFPAGDPVQGWLVYHVTTGDLLCWQDSGTNLPFTPSGSNVTYAPNTLGIGTVEDATP